MPFSPSQSTVAWLNRGSITEAQRYLRGNFDRLNDRVGLPRVACGTGKESHIAELSFLIYCRKGKKEREKD